MGGFRERLIGLVKQCPRKSTRDISLTMVPLETVVNEVEQLKSEQLQSGQRQGSY